MGIPETCTGPGDGVGSGGGTSGGAGAGLIGGAGTGLGGVGGDGGGEARGTGLGGTRGGGGGEAGGAAGAGACTLTSSNTAAIVYTYMDGAGRRERKRREAMKERECKRENVKEIGELCARSGHGVFFLSPSSEVLLWGTVLQEQPLAPVQHHAPGFCLATAFAVQQHSVAHSFPCQHRQADPTLVHRLRRKHVLTHDQATVMETMQQLCS